MPKKILVVEDEKDLREAVVDILVHEKFEVIEARDGEEGLQIALEQHPDLILIDVLMPKMDGMTMLKKIRNDHWGENVPVIVLTNYNASDQNTVEDIVVGRPAHYLIKSDWDIHDIVREIHKILKSSRS